nr:hypothetical protein [Saprospiraceae bacterium]
MNRLQFILLTIFLSLGFVESQQGLLAQSQEVNLFVTHEVDGASVDFFIEATDFRDIEAFQGSLAWDSTGMQFEHFESVGIPNFGSGNLNLNMVGEGKLVFAWFNNTPTPVTVEDCGLIFRLRFQILTGVSELLFDSLPADLLILADVDGVTEAVDFRLRYNEMCQPSSTVDNLFLEEELKIFPNPVQSGGRLHLNDFKPLQPRTVILLDGAGREINKWSLSGKYTLDLPPDLSPGFYFLDIISEDSHSRVVKFMVF